MDRAGSEHPEGTCEARATARGTGQGFRNAGMSQKNHSYVGVSMVMGDIPKYPKNGWFMENPGRKMDDWGGYLYFVENCQRTASTWGVGSTPEKCRTKVSSVGIGMV